MDHHEQDPRGHGLGGARNREHGFDREAEDRDHAKPNNVNKSSPSTQHVGVTYKLGVEDNVNAKLTTLLRQVEALAHAKAATSLTNESSSMCALCDTMDHCTDICPIVAGVKEARGQVDVGQQNMQYFSQNPQNFQSQQQPYQVPHSYPTQTAVPQPMPYVAPQALPPAPRHAQYQPPHRRNEDNELCTKVTSIEQQLGKMNSIHESLVISQQTQGRFPAQPQQNPKPANCIEKTHEQGVVRLIEHFSIERALVWSESHDQLESESVSFRDASIVNEESDSVMHVGHWTPTFEPLAPSVVKPVPSEEKPPIPKIKPLPFTLKYAFLGEGESYPVVISSSLTEGQEESLLKVLKSHRKSLGWTIADLHGISPLMCMHCIYLKEEFKPVRQMQRRLNPNMKEVVRGEVLKLLDAGIIYLISDSKWVSPTQVVPKKSGITGVKNEHNELVPTRIQTGWRMCIDYRKLNVVTRKDHFPLPFQIKS
ncbi:hypothetical protein Acr_18g0009370 [Actinidia rufa]|uniref:Reverse transcriptase domain-containing protein n=1 Tax=Actinidia rufa TaxID=165716 RepID=A0A7J0G7J9_9ERIC|nr:hypothetical protein Acr_18g0009370 [Actinidia rufa]